MLLSPHRPRLLFGIFILPHCKLFLVTLEAGRTTHTSADWWRAVTHSSCLHHISMSCMWTFLSASTSEPQVIWTECAAGFTLKLEAFTMIYLVFVFFTVFCLSRLLWSASMKEAMRLDFMFWVCWTRRAPDGSMKILKDSVCCSVELHTRRLTC